MDNRDYELFFDISQSLTSIAESLDRIADAQESRDPMEQHDSTDKELEQIITRQEKTTGRPVSNRVRNIGRLLNTAYRQGVEDGRADAVKGKEARK